MTDLSKTLAKFDPIVAELAERKIENANLNFDLEDKQGNKDARSHVSKLRKGKTTVAAVHKEAKADALAFGRSLDTRKNELTAGFDEMIDVWWPKIKDIEQREYKRMAEEAEARRLKIEAAEAKRVAELEAREAAMAAKEQAAKEEEERETRERAAKIAEANARITAENEKLRAAQAKLEEEKRAMEAAKLAEEDAHRREIQATEAERERIREEQEAEQAERAYAAELEARRESEEADRIANEEHRAEIEKQTWNDLFSVIKKSYSLGDEIITDTITHYIKNGEIANVTINY